MDGLSETSNIPYAGYEYSGRLYFEQISAVFMVLDKKIRSMLRLDAKEPRHGATQFWHYFPAGIPGVIEFGFWSGVGSHDLRPHFHNETQIAIVLAGSRAFRINDTIVTVAAGEGISIPAGLLHAPLATPNSASVCLNVYLEDKRTASSYNMFNIHDILSGFDMISSENLLRSTNAAPPTVRSVRMKPVTASSFRTALMQSDMRIGDIAADFDRSREGFSRQVTRELGVAPHCFRLLSRLNHARQLLRDGQPIAAVAADAGFSDQSHMTRLFRRTFGTTPGLYRRI